jgi:hypothetical protein
VILTEGGMVDGFIRAQLIRLWAVAGRIVTILIVS